MSKFSWPDSPSQTAYPVAKAGYPFIMASAFTTAVFALLGFTVLSLAGLLATGFICFFFRDPDRAVPNTDYAVVSPADGRVLTIEEVSNTRFFEGACTKISIFMSIFNVHVNRIPYGGIVKGVDYYPGKFFSANLDKASKDNEHNAVFIETDDGQPYCMVQIAGLVARRIICEVHDGHRVTVGQRMGLICFGSRVDLYLPLSFKATAKEGDRVKAGTSILGVLK